MSLSIHEQKQIKKALWLTAATWLLFFSLLWPSILTQNDQGIYSGSRFVWSDWQAHAAYASVFAYRSPVDWFSQHPLFASASFNYPFLPSLISGMLMRLGLPLSLSLSLPSYLAMFSFLLLAAYFLTRFLKSASKAWCSLSLFLLSGGLGFSIYFRDLYESNSLVKSLLFPPREYTGLNDYGIFWANPVVCELLPQRNFLFGLCVLIPLWALMLKTATEKEASFSKSMAAGAMTLMGLLTITHVHLAMATALLFFVLVSFTRDRKVLKLLFVYGGLAAFMALACYFFFLKDTSIKNFLHLRLGWMSGAHHKNFVWFWLLNLGLTLPLAFFVAFRRWKTWPKALKLLFGTGVFIFILCNFVQFSPWDWDTTKMLTVAIFIFAITISDWLVDFFKKRKVQSLILFLLLSFSGGLELIRLMHAPWTKVELWPATDIAAAEHFRSISDPKDIVLIDPQDFSNWAVRLTGRSAFVGYTGTLWSYGFEYREQERLGQQMLQNPAENINLFEENNIRWVIIQKSWDQQKFPSDRFHPLLKTGRYNVYAFR